MKDREIFFKSISKGKLAKLARAAFEDMADGNAIGDWIWGEWRQGIDLMVNAAVHPNHAISMIALFPHAGKPGKSDAIGLRGHPSHNSIRTIRELMIGAIPIALSQLSNDLFPTDGKAGKKMEEFIEKNQKKH